MESGSFEKHINRLRNYYQNKRDAILEIFKTAPLDQYITIKEEDSGVHFMMKLKTERTEMDMMSDSKSKGIKLAPLSKYFCWTNIQCELSECLCYELFFD